MHICIDEFPELVHLTLVCRNIKTENIDRLIFSYTECSILEENCGMNGSCRKSNGVYKCRCDWGFKGNGHTCTSKL